jgi:SAM-dependent methyltransferase
MAKAKSQTENYLTEVREQYENYPYPFRNPEDEKTRLIHVASSALDCMNYYHYSGKRDFTKGFRALVAGGGTGDSIITLAEQVKEFDADIVYLDMSVASMQVAKERAKVRGLENITWVHGSLLDAPKILDGKFDYINCSGVLHHLESPEAGLAALTAVLKDDGVMGIMLYAKYGREAIYQIQNLLKILNKNEQNMQAKVDICKTLLQNLPETNNFMNVLDLFATDINTYGDVGIYDLFLHSNDVAYTVPDLYRFLESSNLKAGHFFFERSIKGNNLYNLESYIKDETLLKAISNLSVEEKQAAAELLHGKIIKHTLYASKIKNPLPDIEDRNNVPILSTFMNKGSYEAIYRIVCDAPIGGVVKCFAKHINTEINFIKTANAELIFKYIDGEKTIGEIFKAIRAEYPANTKKPDYAELQKEFENIFNAFSLYDWMYLKDKSVPKVKTIYEMQSNFL